MSSVDDYIDARTLLDDYQQMLCPEVTCGQERWFKYRQHRYERNTWVCESCGKRRHHVLEYPCPECDVRLDIAGQSAFCHNPDCEVDEIEFPKSELIDRLSAEHDARGMPRALMGLCPVCGADHSVNGDPDGALVCRECDDFYAGRYSDSWYCYAIWMQEPDKIRVNV